MLPPALAAVLAAVFTTNQLYVLQRTRCWHCCHHFNVATSTGCSSSSRQRGRGAGEDGRGAGGYCLGKRRCTHARLTVPRVGVT